MNENKYLEEQRKLHGARHPKVQEAEMVVGAKEYDHEAIEGRDLPFIVEKLQIHDGFRIDPQINVRAMAVDEFIRNRMQEEGMRDSEVSYNTIFDRMASPLAASLEPMIRSGKGTQILDILFGDVAINNKKSSETFQEEFDQKVKTSRIESLLRQLGELLLTH